MKKIIFIIPAIFLFSVAIFAQTDSEQRIEWKTLAPETEEFSVDVPDSVKFSIFYDRIANSIYDKKQNRRYSGMTGKTYFFILSDISAYDPQFKVALKFVEVNRKDELEKQKSAKTMKFKFADDENFFHTIYAVKTESRSYVFHLVSENENDPNVERFFKSLIINKKPANIKFEKEIAQTKNEIQKTAEKPVENKNSGQSKTTSETGRGQGNSEGNIRGLGAASDQGSGFGIGIGSLPDDNKINVTKALTITSKPKPKYTDFARFYEITGNVRMRTTFLKDGTIGSTTPITRLPFGLTKSSIEAAKQMRFEPMTVKEKPLAVSKVVVFNFTIY